MQAARLTYQLQMETTKMTVSGFESKQTKATIQQNRRVQSYF